MSDATKPFPLALLGLLFFASGVAGLVYQVAWQRILFSSFGADIESVTVVVSAFMLGLGLGALVGGKLADRLERRRLYLFVACEVAIGSYGFVSAHILRAGGEMFVASGLPTIAAVNFLLIVIPTLFMGATLPVLVSYLATLWANVGRATGHLYALNTLGAWLGALATGFWVFYWATLDQAIYMAATTNIAIALVSLAMLRRAK